MRPTILVDMDGPLANFDAKFFDLCRTQGYAMDIEHPHEQRHRFSTDHIVDRAHRSAARRHVERAPWFHDLPVVDGAVEGMLALAEVAEVWIVTKPLEANRTCASDKMAWVRNWLPEFERRIVITADKSIVMGDVLLDDAPKPEWFPRAPWQPVIYRCPFNGKGSKWGVWPQWDWAEPIGDLVEMAARAARDQAPVRARPAGR